MAIRIEKAERSGQAERAAASVYTAEELASGYGAFGVPKEMVVAALHCAGKATATFEEAAKLIKTFCKMEVR